MKFSSTQTAATLVASALALGVTGCVSFHAADARREQTQQFSKTLDSRVQTFLTRPLTLEDCVRIAMTNNYDIRLADLDAKLARFDKFQSYSAFMPQVNYMHQQSYLDKALEGSDNSKMDLAMGSLPIVAPATWYLYDAARHAQAAQELRAKYVRQSIVLQTTTAYYNVRVQEDLCKAREQQVQAAKQTADRAKGLASEGYARPWESDRAVQLYEARSAQLSSARRELTKLQGDLLKILGMPPLVPLALSREDPLQPALEGSLEDLVMEALTNNPALSIADRQVVAREAQVREAFCAFLPTLSFDGMALHAQGMDNNLLGSFGVAWNIFSGFANTQKYRKARVEREQAELSRELTFLSIMNEVVAAHAQLLDAAAMAQVNKRGYEVAAGKAEDLEARSKEGLTPLNEALDAAAERDEAQTTYLQSAYQERVARAVLELALGRTLVPEAARPEDFRAPTQSPNHEEPIAEPANKAPEAEAPTTGPMADAA